jgi:hypothetical protein
MNTTVKALLLLFFFSLCGSAIVVTHRTRGHATSAAPHELFSVVNRQLVAFRSSDFPSAYRNAASAVQQKFTLRQFELMIRRDYPEMTRSHRIEFGVVKVDGASAIVQVLFVSADGRVRPYLYSLTAEQAGWKIEGVEPMPPTQPNERLSGLHI